ncbi:MAG: hypothetical protein NC311_02235 [Muribaculaceae bacterium]|nr:hypothetical protein [Muribaculaceae bacterium]
MKTCLIIIPTALLALSPAYAASLGPGTSTLSCLCSDGSVVATGKRCPDGMICGGASLEKDCPVGYYGTTTDGLTGCNRCPEWTGIYTDAAHTLTAAATSGNGRLVITGCYIPAGTYYDATGTFTLTSNCTYSN